MTLRTIIIALTMLVAAVLPAQAQRGGNNWELLGEARVAFRGDSDVIALGHNEDYYRARAYRRLRFVIDGGEVRMRFIKLVYLNGYSEDIEVLRTLGPGEQFDLDLRGERSFLREIHIVHKGKFGLSIGGGGIRVAKPSVKVFGENVRFAPPPREDVRESRGGGRGWEQLATERFDRREDRLVMPVGRREGRFGQLAIEVEGDSIVIRDVRIRFGNGDVQRIEVNRRVEDGQRSPPVDLEGNRRFIEEIVFNLEPRRRPGAVTLTLFGKQEPGRDDDRGDRERAGRGFRPPSDWTLLGRQSVNLGLDRDSIDVDRTDASVGYDRLHFVAENNELFMRGVRIVYLNGYVEELKILRLIPAGSDLALDLPGKRSFIRRIETLYSAKPGFRGETIVSVYGAAGGRRR
jgi:hypothetical protein